MACCKLGEVGAVCVSSRRSCWSAGWRLLIYFCTDTESISSQIHLIVFLTRMDGPFSFLCVIVYLPLKEKNVDFQLKV